MPSAGIYLFSTGGSYEKNWLIDGERFGFARYAKSIGYF